MFIQEQHGHLIGPTTVPGSGVTHGSQKQFQDNAGVNKSIFKIGVPMIQL